MEKEQVIKALYDAYTMASIQVANDQWLACYQASSESEQQYLLAEYHRFGEHLKKRDEELDSENGESSGRIRSHEAGRESTLATKKEPSGSFFTYYFFFKLLK